MRRMNVVPGLVAAALVFLMPGSAYAYAGPGGVLTAIGAFLALFFALVASIVGFLWYPLKRLRIWLRRPQSDADQKSSSPETADIR